MVILVVFQKVKHIAATPLANISTPLFSGIHHDMLVTPYKPWMAISQGVLKITRSCFVYLPGLVICSSLSMYLAWGALWRRQTGSTQWLM
ncbi:uncharacterized protein CYBJADRAFT_186447 [Cyberlindnera jadinii NRRL Y-1542]|uniref:Uncharacterized protein n=1 Tax=Cyberlindnera jadinii (strain ATCC 18201 / CBS 1600 / BCRC 20928 / JCM 3617 / NBRC 0987 / NRRL Y-1542) TaxID=983966 RepID=A0A1E4RWB5_CYBJN|nr:hypothetical protein CYBJADRAFT_186447 [Cyberlindnera jadinii NRRL Y-1542]ODV71567.1 hypothetical protein CYBJADRAFT_186447 [Cyberlindnera jadinii NRRL Y-1542]